MGRNRRIGPIGLSLLVLVILIPSLVFVVPVTMAQQKVFNLRLQRYPGIEMDEVFNKFSEDIDVMSGGRIKIKNFRGGELVPNDQILDAVSKGTLDMGNGYGGYWPGLVDVAKIESGLPSAWTSLDEYITFYYDKGFSKLLREAYAEKGVYYLSPAWGGAYELLTKKPVHSLKDLRTMKIRTTATIASIMKKVGVPTVYLPPEELYTAMASGTIDGAIYGSAWDYTELKLNEIAKYYTMINLLNPGYVDNVLINLKLWQSLSPDLQRILELGSLASLCQGYHNYAISHTAATLEKGIFTVGALPPEDVAAIAEAAQDVWKEEAGKSPRNAKAIQMLREIAKAGGRVK
jgi:TRAP-type mannitol/chloroaromatic compound transport system substrate-binding protein